MERQRTSGADELCLGPADERSRPTTPSARAVPALVVTAAVVAAGLSGPALLSGSPVGPSPSPSPSASAVGGADAPTVRWTGSMSRSATGNAFVQSSTRLLRLPAT